jgi:hypothetical protein
MNGAKTLLSAMWRGSDTHQIATLKDGRFSNNPVQSIEDALQKAKTLDASGHDVYFACAEFKSPDNRKASNASGAWGYWLDIDCGEEKALLGAGYATKIEASQALTAFLNQTDLPRSSYIVDSGNGLHVYFSADELIPAKEWRQAANNLKELAEKCCFLADPSRTSDIASVLRLPGTHNYKDPANPKVVRLVYPKEAS